VSHRGAAIWIVGLPGCGKSSIAQGIVRFLAKQEYDVVLLAMDDRRKEYFPKPEYTAQERDEAYALFIGEAVDLVSKGVFVVMDASAYKVEMRTLARRSILLFAEIFIHCELEIAIKRESLRAEGKIMAGLYEKALERKRTGRHFAGLGDVIGVDVEFEKNPDAEFILDNSYLTEEEALGKVLHFLDMWLKRA